MHPIASLRATGPGGGYDWAESFPGPKLSTPTNFKADGVSWP